MRPLALATAAVSCFTCARGQEEEQAALLQSGEQQVKPLNVAIVGMGAGGASSAYHLAKFARAAQIPVNITIFERNATAGGRSTTVNAYGASELPIELGASIFVKVNSILNDAVKEFNLSTENFMPGKNIPGASLGVWDGKDFVITLSDGWSDTAKLLWKYRLAPVKTMRLMRKVVGRFLKMYEEPVFPFESLTEAAQYVDLLNVTATTGEQYMAANGITGAFGWDVVQASTRVNYATNLQYIHGLEAMVCMAAEGGSSVHGGNWQIFDGMIAASNATTHYDTPVSGIKKGKNDGYAITFSNSNPESEEYAAAQSQLFDSVILAAPYQFADLELPHQIKDAPDKIPYVKLHTTLFTSPHLLSPSFFNLGKGTFVPHSVLTTLPKDEEPKKGMDGVGSTGFFSISLLQPVVNPKTGGEEYVYKIFSAEPPNSTFFTRLLGLRERAEDGTDDIDPESGVSRGDVTWIYRKLWHSYPYEYPRVTFERIQLDDNLWYTSGMDSFISTMETNALMGMNVARLIVDKWEQELGAVEYGKMLEKEMEGTESGEIFDLETVTLIVGAEQEKMLLHRSHIRKSRFLDAAFKEQRSKGAKELLLPEDKVEITRGYLHWLYTAKLHRTAQPAPDSQHNQETMLLARLFVLGEKFQDTCFKNAVVDAIIGKHNDPDKGGCGWPPT